MKKIILPDQDLFLMSWVFFLKIKLNLARTKDNIQVWSFSDNYHS